jgi:topoisomerase-4 subunit A
MIYVDGESGTSYAKRFNVSGITRDKEYDLTNKGAEKTKVHHFSANPNGEAEVVKIILDPNSPARKKEFDYYFEELEIKSRNSMGNQVTKFRIKTVKFKEAGKSTLGGRKLWFDDQFGRLNTESKGEYLGSFQPEDKILVVYNDGNYEITDQELTQKFDIAKVIEIEKFAPEKILTAIYLDNDKQQFNVKRFKIETTTLRSKFMMIKEGDGNYLEAVTTHPEPIIQIKAGRGAQARTQKIKIYDFVEVMGWKAVGNKLTDFTKSTEFEWVMKEQKEDPEQPELF